MDTDNFLHFGKLLLYFWRKIQNPMKWSEVAQSCPTLCDPMDCSLPGSIHEIFQARILEWVAISFSRGSSRPRDRTWVFHIAGTFVLSHTKTDLGLDLKAGHSLGKHPHFIFLVGDIDYQNFHFRGLLLACYLFKLKSSSLPWSF